MLARTVGRSEGPLNALLHLGCATASTDAGHVQKLTVGTIDTMSLFARGGQVRPTIQFSDLSAVKVCDLPCRDWHGRSHAKNASKRLAKQHKIAKLVFVPLLGPKLTLDTFAMVSLFARGSLTRPSTKFSEFFAVKVYDLTRRLWHDRSHTKNAGKCQSKQLEVAELVSGAGKECSPPVCPVFGS